MEQQEPSSAFISALTTEHYVLQSAVAGNTSEVGTRASLYLFSLSSTLVALGFVSRSPELFVPFVAIVLPALFILGLFTAVRLVDSNLEGILYLNGIARIRRYYRTLGRDAPEAFSPEFGRWPENHSWPALRMGPSLGLITTTASMIAFLNSVVAGVGVAMLVGGLVGEHRRLVPSLIGAGVALGLMALFYWYQKWRFDSTTSGTPEENGR
jgi:prepilin signal peptidase PulO-like enzyme (type II secretory pathway)